MKKYKTTKNHPLGKGIKFNENCQLPQIYWLEKGWIKEVKEKEFTESDILDVIEFTDNRGILPHTESFENIYHEWLKQRK